jgi:RNA polymerase primary sigma factor
MTTLCMFSNDVGQTGEKINDGDWQETENWQKEQSTKPHLQPLEELSARYMRLISRSQLLSQEEEAALAKRIERGEIEAKAQLALANLRLVIKVARRYAGRGAAFMDLVQEGNFGLMKAVEKFDYRLGYRFSTYAMCWIKQSVFQAFTEADRPIRLPGHVMDSVIKLRKMRHVLQEKLNRSPSELELSQHMGVSLKKIQQLSQISQSTVSLESEITLRNGNSQTLSDLIEDERLPEPGEALCKDVSLKMLRMALFHHLDERERDILFRRFGFLHTTPGEELPKPGKMTLEEIGMLYGVTRECVRQTELRAIRKLRASAFLQNF